MADTADRRKEGKLYRNNWNTDERAFRENMGLCNRCGKVKVVNRKTCYKCVDKQTLHNMRYFVKKAAKLGFVTIVRPI